jgi:hypothetical protein
VSATILTVIVLIVMWVVVLVPLLVRRAEESEEAAALWAPAMAGAALSTDQGTIEFTDHDVEPSEPAAEADTAWAASRPDRASIARATSNAGEAAAAAGSDRAGATRAARDADETAWAAAGSDRAAAARAGDDAASERVWTATDRPRAAPVRRRPAVLARRRRALAVLALLAIATAGAATVASPALWLANAASDVLLLGYLTRLRAGARNAHRARREAARREVRARSAPRPAAPAYRTTQATRRPSQVIGLDDEDPSFAQIEVRYPRAANE